MNYPRLLRKLRWPAALLTLVCYASVSWAQGGSWQEEVARIKAPLQEKDPAAFAAMARVWSAQDRGVASHDNALIHVNTYNFGNAISGRIFSTGRCHFPNADGYARGYIFESSPAIAVPPGPWFSKGLVHENTDFHSSTKLDWEAKDGARGIHFSNPPQMYYGFPVFAISDQPATWPTTGWPAPETVEDTWTGVTVWKKWERVGDRNSYAVFDDKYADREGDGQSTSLGIEVKKRTISYSALNIIFMQYEFTNTSPHNYVDVYVGSGADRGSPTVNDWTGSTLVWDGNYNLIYARSVNYDPTTGQHWRGGVNPGALLAFGGEMYLETPGGNFREDPYDPDDPGINYVSDPTNILTRVALFDWGDRVLDDEESLFGAYTAEISYMESDDAEHIWKLSQNAGQPVLMQDETHYQGYNLNWDTSTDHMYYCTYGPFDFPANSSFDMVVAYVGGYTQPDMLENAAKAVHTYNLQFKGPGPPPTPTNFRANGIEAGPAGRDYDPRLHAYKTYFCPEGNLTVSWDPSNSMTTPDPSSGVRDFEGIRIYRSQDRGATWGQQVTDHLGNFVGYAPYRQWDLADGITGDDGMSYTYLGDDTGIVTSFTDDGALDGVEYWYAITAFDQGEFDPVSGDQLLRSLESTRGADPSIPMVIAAVSGSRPAGFTSGNIGGETAASVDPTVSGPYTSDGMVMVNVATDAEVIGATYRITTSDSGSYGTVDKTGVIGVTLENLTSGQTLFTSLLPEDEDYGSGLLPITEGLQVEMTTLINANDPWDLIDHDFPTGYAPYGGYEMLYGDDWFMNSELSHNSLTDLANRYTTVEIRFDTTQTQMAYVYNRTGGYQYVGYNTFPGTAWDVDASPERQINIAYTRQSAKGTNLDWDIDDNPLGNNRHYTSVLASDYSGTTPDTAYTTGTKSDWSGSDLDHMWSTIPGMDTGLTWRDLHGLTVTYMYDHPIGPNWQYEFTTTAPSFDDSVANLQEVKAVPNPYYITAAWDQSVNKRKIQFINVPPNSLIEIYTLAGELVASLDHHGDATATAGGRGYNSNRIGTVDWNIWTYEFTEAAYGLYVFVVKTDGGKTQVGKFAIIR